MENRRRKKWFKPDLTPQVPVTGPVKDAANDVDMLEQGLEDQLENKDKDIRVNRDFIGREKITDRNPHAA